MSSTGPYTLTVCEGLFAFVVLAHVSCVECEPVMTTKTKRQVTDAAKSKPRAKLSLRAKPSSERDHIDIEVASVLENVDLAALLQVEKEKRGVRPEKRVFIGMADTANYYWCAMQSLYEFRDNEAGYFHAYLSDRLQYSMRLGLVKKLPKRNHSKLLEIGDNITLADVGRLLRQEKKFQKQSRKWAVALTDDDGERVVVIDTEAPAEEITKIQRRAKAEGMRCVMLNEVRPRIRGRVVQRTRGELYPSIRWNFRWNDYVVVGIPDGLTDDFAYEFKSTRNRRLSADHKPVALAQANLYAYFFQRANARSQILVMDEDHTETWDTPVDPLKAEFVLGEIRKLLEEGVIPQPPKASKCWNM